MHTAELDWITPDAERVIARHARVSTTNPDRQEYKKLVTYCIHHGHWSILEQAAASFQIVTTRAISPQILRHRSFSFQELSQRYTNPWEIFQDSHMRPHEFSLRQQAEKNRQSSTMELQYELLEEFRKRIYDLDNITKQLYEDMLEAEVARECARNILPLYTPTRLHMQGTIRSFVHYVGLRGQPDTQLEHRQIALSIGRVLADQLPVISEALSESQDKSLAGWKHLL